MAFVRCGYLMGLIAAVLPAGVHAQELSAVLVEGNSISAGVVSHLSVPVAGRHKQIVVPAWVVTTSGTKLALIKIRNGERSLLALSMQAVQGQTYALYDLTSGTTPTVNPNGSVLFNANYYYSGSGTQDGQGLYSGSLPGVITKRVHDGDAAPDGNGLLDVRVSNRPALARNGQMAFYADIYGAVGGLGNGGGIYAGAGTAFTRIVRTGQIPPMGTSYFTGFSWPTINDSGTVAFVGALNNGPDAVYTGSGGALREIARVGQEIIPDWTIFRIMSDGVPINARGEVAFCVGIGSANYRAIFLDTPGGMKRIAYGGQTPTVGSGTVPNAIGGNVSLNDRGQIAFQGSYLNGNHGIFRAQDGSLVSIAREGGPVPGTVSGTFTVISGLEFALNAAGDVVFEAQFRTGADAQKGLFFYSDRTGLLPPIVQYGSPLAGGVVDAFDFLGNAAGAFRSGGSSGLDDDGDVTFRFELTTDQRGIATYSSRSSLFADGFE